MQKKRICYFIGSLQTGGAEKHVLQLIENIDKNKFEVYLCLLNKVDRDTIEEVKRSYSPVHVKVFNAKQFFGIFYLLRIIHFAFYLRVNKIKILHIHLVGSFFFASLAGKIANISQVLVSWHSVYKYRSIRKKTLKNTFVNLNLYVGSIFCDKVIAVSNRVKVENCNNLRVKEDKVVVVYNGIDLPQKSNTAASKENFVIGAVGNLYKDKGYINLLRSIPKLVELIPSIKVIIVGEGNERSQLEKFISDHNLENYVDLVGRKNNVRELITAFDIWIMVSLREGFSLAVLEAMSASLPVIATNVGGNSEAIINEESGLIIDPNNTEDIINSVSYLYQNQEKREQFASKAYSRYRDHFTTQKMMEGLYQLY